MNHKFTETKGFKHGNGRVKISLSLTEDNFNFINSLAREYMVSFNVAAHYLISGAVQVDRDMWEQDEDPSFRLSGGIEKHRPAYLDKRNEKPVCKINVKPDVFEMLTKKEETHDEFVARMLRENADQP